MRSVKPIQGALLLALSALLFSLMGVVIREASATVNNESVVFFRNLVGVLFETPGRGFHKMHVEAAQTMIEAAKAQGVARSRFGVSHTTFQLESGALPDCPSC